jgi:hypothetical protein
MLLNKIAIYNDCVIINYHLNIGANMRTITVEHQVAKFNELNDEQKTKVLDNYRNINTDYDFLSYYITEYTHDLEILGFSNVN